MKLQVAILPFYFKLIIMKGSKLSKTEVVSGFRNTPDIGSLKVKDATEDVAKALEVAELERNARFK